MKIQDQPRPLSHLLPLLNINVKKGIDCSLQRYIYLYSDVPEESENLSQRVFTILTENQVSQCRLLFRGNHLYIENGAHLESELESWATTDDRRLAKNSILNAFYQNSTSLDLTGLNLETLPDCMSSLIFLQTLTLDYTRIEKIPPWISQLNHLRSLSLQLNKLTALPSELENCSALEELSLSHNNFSQFPSVIFKLKALCNLSMDYCSLSNIPFGISTLHSLNEINLGGNELVDLPADFGCLPELTSLNCKSNSFKQIPSNVFRLNKLNCLVFSNNSLKSVPDSLRQLSQLNELYLDSNQITDCGDGLFCLPLLCRLNLSNNLLSHFEAPDQVSFYNFSQLEFLDLSSNQLKDLPLNMSEFSSLETLDISDNSDLKMLPLSLGKCKILSTINSNNTAIPIDLSAAILSQIINIYEDPRSRFNILIGKLAAVCEKQTSLSLQDQLNESDLQILADWLERCESINEMKTSPKEYSQLLLDMLDSLEINGEYRNIFIQQIRLNNSDCEDRTAISNAHLYCLWQLEFKILEGTLKEKLTLAIGLGKTLVLRKKVSQIISSLENKRKRTHEEQSEIYLYVEKELREELGLITPCTGMVNEQIGKQEWLSLDEVKKYILKNYLSEASSFDAVIKLARQDPHVNSQLEQLNERLQNECSFEEGESEEAFRTKNELFRWEYEKQKNLIISKWIERVLKSET